MNTHPFSISRLMATALLIVSAIISVEAHAVPAFARQEGVKCTACHNAWPQLNARGRQFKENGYRFKEDANEPRKLSELMDEGVPMAAILVARPFDKKKDKDAKNRAFHELELFTAGALNDKWSGIAEIEAEDETEFSPEVASGILAYRFNQALNLAFGWAPYFLNDSYGLLGDGFRMTRGHVDAIDTAFGGADGGNGLRASRQVTAIYGRPFDQLFYSVGYSGIAKDAEGESAKNLHARLAVDVTPDVMLGGFLINGDNTSTQQGFTRAGIDFQADVSGARFQGVYIRGKDDVTGGGSESNNALSLQAMYMGDNQKSGPTWVPVIRYDSHEENDGANLYSAVTLNMTRYFSQNIKGYIEYWKQIDTPSGITQGDRITAQVTVAF